MMPYTDVRLVQLLAREEALRKLSLSSGPDSESANYIHSSLILCITQTKTRTVYPDQPKHTQSDLRSTLSRSIKPILHIASMQLIILLINVGSTNFMTSTDKYNPANTPGYN